MLQRFGSSRVDTRSNFDARAPESKRSLSPVLLALLLPVDVCVREGVEEKLEVSVAVPLLEGVAVSLPLVLAVAVPLPVKLGVVVPVPLPLEVMVSLLLWLAVVDGETVCEAVPLTEGVKDGVGVGALVAFADPLDEIVPVPLEVTEPEIVCVGLPVLEPLTLGDVDEDVVTVPDEVTELEKEPDCVPLGVPVKLELPLPLVVPDALKVPELLCVLLVVLDCVGEPVTSPVGLGLWELDPVGLKEPLPVPLVEAVTVGLVVPLCVLEIVCDGVGDEDVVSEGVRVGEMLGVCVALIVLLDESVGSAVCEGVFVRVLHGDQAGGKAARIGRYPHEGGGNNVSCGILPR